MVARREKQRIVRRERQLALEKTTIRQMELLQELDRCAMFTAVGAFILVDNERLTNVAHQIKVLEGIWNKFVTKLSLIPAGHIQAEV